MVNLLRFVFVAAICVLLPVDNNVVVEASTFSDLVDVFFRPLWNILVQGTCNAIAPNFDDGFRLGCKCRGIFNQGSALEGLGGEFVCQNDDTYCLINNPSRLYCGTVDLEVDFNARSGPTNIVGCFNVDSNLPPDVSGGEFPRICATLKPNGLDFTFKSCEIKFGRQKCDSCTICENKRDLKFNCSNINVNPAGTPVVQGPALTTCEGFGFLDKI